MQALSGLQRKIQSTRILALKKKNGFPTLEVFLPASTAHFSRAHFFLDISTRIAGKSLRHSGTALAWCAHHHQAATAPAMRTRLTKRGLWPSSLISPWHWNQPLVRHQMELDVLFFDVCVLWLDYKVQGTCARFRLCWNSDLNRRIQPDQRPYQPRPEISNRRRALP